MSDASPVAHQIEGLGYCRVHDSLVCALNDRREEPVAQSASFRSKCLLGGASTHKAHDERIRALEAELAKVKEELTWAWRDGTHAEAFRDLQKERDALKARVAEQEIEAQRCMELFDGFETVHQGGGRDSGKAEARAGAVRRDIPEAVRDRSAAAIPAARGARDAPRPTDTTECGG